MTETESQTESKSGQSDIRAQTASIASPCIRVCCLDADDICLGCFRSLDEIKQWQASDDNTRAMVLHACAQRRAMHDERFPSFGSPSA